MGDQSTGVVIWWTVLGLVSIANVGAWFATAAQFARDRSSESPGVHAAARRQLCLAALFVVGCAFRSFFPTAEAQRICLYDSQISNAMISRAVATVAELCLVTQWALVLHKFASDARARLASTLAPVLVILIALAEICSWYTATTTNFIGSVFEESLWAFASMLMILSLSTLRSRYRGRKRRFIRTAVIVNAAYVAFMCTIDVPMYVTRWRADEREHRQYLSVSDGWRDAQQRRIVTRAWSDWRQEIPWMSLYFTAGVWISIGLSRVPRLYQGAAQRGRTMPA